MSGEFEGLGSTEHVDIETSGLAAACSGLSVRASSESASGSTLWVELVDECLPGALSTPPTTLPSGVAPSGLTAINAPANRGWALTRRPGSA